MTSSMAPATDRPIETQTREPVSAAVVWLHGLGADGYDFAGIVPELRLASDFGVRFVFPHAPMRPVTLNNGYVMRAWYDLNFTDKGIWQEQKHIDESVQAVHTLVAREVDRGVPAERIVLAGFSQGGVIALHAALRSERRLAGAVVLSAPIPSLDELLARAAAANAGLPVFLGYGRYDTIGPMIYGKQVQAALGRESYPVEWHDYPMEHSVCGEEVSDIGGFLGRVLGRPGATP